METPTTQATWLSAEEAGYLKAGPRRAAEAVLARLIDNDLVRVSREGLVSAVHQNGHGATTSVEARMLSYARTPVPFEEILPSTATSTEMVQLHQHLLGRGLMQRGRHRHDGWWFSLAIAILLFVLGFSAPGCFYGVPIALGFFFWQYGRSPVTHAGKEALRQVTANDRVHAVALHGFDGRIATQSVRALFGLPEQLVVTREPARARKSRRSSSDGAGYGAYSACGSSSGCGSSGCSGGSSCGGGGGGCGGGGGS
ncbi:TIGR04222 domain-containing membrane protein [Lentzea sp. JNUCC 0626]|uniref:TIGR04222 domain-containing membrane protein n=1 Tax=Lentzea sp. JNUCC 0626 TaxID=3367513 RepID=UPI003747A900